MRILRQTIPVGSSVIIEAPSQHSFLSTAPARDGTESVDVWWMANDGECHQVRINIYGTGHPVESNPGHFIGTCVMPSNLVWHVFTKDVSVLE